MNNRILQILANLHIDKLNQLQEKSYRNILNNNDTMIVSPTGSGKTLAFLLPLSELISKNSNVILALIIVPSRELVLQIESVWRKMNTGFRVATCYGGHDISIEIKNLKNNPPILIATPGRLLDHLDRKSFDSSTIKYLVLDEFDKSLELGFQEQMSQIIDGVPSLDKRIFTSATSEIEMPDYFKSYQPLLLDVNSSVDVSYYAVISEDKDKADKLFQLICSLNSESAIIFCNHRESAERIRNFINEKGVQIGYYHGGLDQADRERILIQFRNGSMRYLVTTDLAARGLDIPEIKHVIHYHLPAKESDFIHRNGRTARMGASGTIYLLLFVEENVPEYVNNDLKILKLGAHYPLPDEPLFETIYISGGRKNKLSKADVVGFLIQKGGISKEDLGLIELTDFSCFVAVRKDVTKSLLKKLINLKMKGKKYKIELARTLK